MGRETEGEEEGKDGGEGGEWRGSGGRQLV